MSSPVVGAVLAFLGGTAVAGLNYLLDLRALRKNPSSIVSLAPVRQILNVAYLAAAFFLARVLPWDHVPLLLGAALGLTVPSLLFAVRLARRNDAAPERKGDEENG